MSYDPLSAASRQAKSRLLTASSILFIIELFDVELTNIPGFGIEIEAPGAVLNFVFFTGTVYLLIIFLIYALQDFSYSTGPERYRFELDRLEKIFKDEVSSNTRVELTEGEIIEGIAKKELRTFLTHTGEEKNIRMKYEKIKSQYTLYRNIRVASDLVFPVGFSLFSLVYALTWGEFLSSANISRSAP
ncbi:hypothetical protein [Vannielia litorea]|uniref:hypothetical protein n=1 Tax=Vannielia litorea TaxID=1217970 RepID=UPI001C972130|nr:hypothetical protein [Vannielia litorea]MBY6047422.1 hypothetical protein [Vannielia litorea]MBY6074836.1 hypothetical protein [Vannielia litorea]